MFPARGARRAVLGEAMLRAAKAVLVIFTFGFLLSCGSVPAKPAKANQQPAVAEEEKKRQSQDSGIVPPEIVRSKNVRVAFGLKTVTVGNINGNMCCHATSKLHRVV